MNQIAGSLRIVTSYGDHFLGWEVWPCVWLGTVTCHQIHISNVSNWPVVGTGLVAREGLVNVWVCVIGYALLIESETNATHIHLASKMLKSRLAMGRVWGAKNCSLTGIFFWLCQRIFKGKYSTTRIQLCCRLRCCRLICQSVYLLEPVWPTYCKCVCVPLVAFNKVSILFPAPLCG